MAYVISEHMRNKLNAAGTRSLAASSIATETTKKEKKNKGGLLGGLGYTLGQLGTGIFGVGEGIYDFVVGGIADIIGQDDYTKRLLADDITGRWQEGLNDWYNPSSAMQFVGDVAGGLGQTAAYVGLNLIPGAGQYLSTGAMFTSAAGRGVISAYQKTGKLGAKEWLYGLGSGTVEAGLELATGTVGKIAGSIKGASKNVAKSAVRSGILRSMWDAGKGEFVEESLSELIDPYLQRATIDPNAKNASLQEIFRAGMVGLVSGAVGGAGGTTIGNVGSLNRGKRITKTGNTDFSLQDRKLGERTASSGSREAVLQRAQTLLSKIDNAQNAETVAGNLLALKGSYDAYNKLTNKDGIRGQMLLGEMARNIAYTELSGGVEASKADIKQHAETLAQYLTNQKGQTYTAEDIKNNKDGILTDLAIADFSAKMLIDPDIALTMVKRGESGVLDMASQYEAWRNNLTAEQLQEANTALGIDLSTSTFQDFNKAMGAFNASNQQQSSIETRKAQAQPMPDSISLQEGETAVYKTDSGEYLAVKKEAEGYLVAADDANGNGLGKTGKHLTEEQVNELVRGIKQGKQAPTETSKVKEVKAKMETSALTEEGRAMVKDFDNLPASTQARIREMIATGNKFSTVSKSDMEFVANLMAKRGGVSFVFTDFGKDGANGLFTTTDKGKRFIQLNANNSSEAIKVAAVHELAHELRKSNAVGYESLSKAALKILSKEELEEIKTAYTKYYKQKGVDTGSKEFADLLDDEYQAHAMQKLFGKKQFLERYINYENKGILEQAKGVATKFANKFKGVFSPAYRQYDKLIKTYEAVLAMPSLAEASGESERASLSSMSVSFFGKEKPTIADFESRKYKETEGYKKYVESCVENMRQTRGQSFNEKSAREEIESSIDGIVDVAVAMKKAGYDIIDEAGKRKTKDSKGRSLFSSLEPNSDYITSSDISTICDKRKNFSEIHDDIVKREKELGVPEGKGFFDTVDNYFVLHKILADKGLTQPCKQCYVESMRKNLAPMANAFLSIVRETDAENTANKQLWSKAKNSDEIYVIGRDGKKYVKKATNTEIRNKVLDALEAHPEYNLSASDLTVEMLSTEDGLTQLRIQAPLIYEYFNSFYGQAKPKMPRQATPFRFGELTAMLTDERGKIKQGLVEQIKSTGGFRLQSYSDFQIENFADVLQVIFEAGTLGLNGHAYTKVPAFLDATAGTNLKRNISIFMYNDGKSWKLDKNDSFPYDLEKIYEIVNKDGSGNTGIIAVVQNDDMAAWVMANDNIGYFIPFHKSGIKMDVVRDTDVVEGTGKEKKVVKGYKNVKDHTKQQSEVWAKTEGDHKANTKVKKGINIYDFWDFKNADGLSEKDLIKKNVKAYINECNKAGYLPKFRDYVMNNDKILKSTLAYAKEQGFVDQNATIDDISFEYSGYRIPYGYYKCLGDFGMFKPNGEASPIKTLSLKNYNFDKAVRYFSNAQSLRRTEILQQIANGEERERIRNSNMTTAEIVEYVQNLRKKVVDEVVGEDTSRLSIKIGGENVGTNGKYEFDTDSAAVLQSTKDETTRYSIKYAKRDISQITQKDYDHHAWAFVNNVLNTQDEYGRLMNAVSDIKLKFKYPKTTYGEYMIPVAYENGVSKIVFTDGKYEYPSISMVAEIIGGSKYLEDLFNEQQKGYKNERIIECLVSEENDIFTLYRRRDFRGLRELQEQSANLQGTNENPAREQDGQGNSGSSQETIRQSIPTKIDTLSAAELEKLSDEEFNELYDFFGIDDILAASKDTDVLSDFSSTWDDISVQDVSEETKVEPKKVEILFKRKGLGKSHIARDKMAVMTNDRINKEIKDSGATNKTYARAYITRISPKDFIDLTVAREHLPREVFDAEVKGEHDSTMATYDFSKALKETAQTPYLEIYAPTGRVIGHNGRHRIRALEMAGIESVEIMVAFFDEDLSLIKYNAATIPNLAISSQFDTAIETHLYNVIPLNESHRDEIKASYGEVEQDTAIRYSISYAPTGKTAIAMTTKQDKRAFRDRVREANQTTRIAFIDAQAAIADEFKRLGVDSGEALIQAARSATSKAQHAIGGNIVDITEFSKSGKEPTVLSKGVAKIMQPVRKANLEAEFFDYLFNLHNIDRMQVGKSINGKTIKQSQETIALIEKTHPEYKEDAKKWAKTSAEKIEKLSQKPGVALNKDFVEYLINIRNIQSLSETKPVNGNTIKESKNVVADYEKAHPEFKEWQKDWSDMVNALMTLRLKAGLITQELYDELKARYPHYVPTFREEGKSSGTAGDILGKYDLSVKRTIKNAKGSTDTLLRPDEMIARQTLELYRAIEQNNLLNALYDAGASKGSTSLEIVSREKMRTSLEKTATDNIADLETINEDKPNSATNTVTFFKEGEKITLRVSKNIFTGLEALHPGAMAMDEGWLLKGMRKVMNAFKSGVTNLNPFFLARNAARDIQDAIIYTKNDAGFLKAYPRAYAEMAKNGNLWQLYVAAGGMSSSVFDSHKGFVGSLSDRGFAEVEGNIGKRVLQRIDTANLVVEQLPRFTEFIASIEAGKSVDQAILDSADVTVNFGRSGKITKWLNSYLIPFLNASVQGASKTFRTFTRIKTGKEFCSLVVRCAIFGIAPAVLSSIMYDDDEDYQNLRTEDKQNYYLFKVGDKFIKIPRGRLAALLSGVVVRTDLARRGEDDAFKGLGKSALETLTPVESASRSIFSPFADVKNNVTWYGTAIEGREFDNKAVKDRYDEGTSSIAIALGKLKIMQEAGMSPKKIHYLIDQYAGVLGDIFLPMTTKKAERNPLASNFTVDPITNNKLSTKFYKLYDETTYASSAGDSTAALKLRHFNKVKQGISDLYKQKDEIQASKLSDKEKLARTRIIQTLINEAYKTAIDESELWTKAFADSEGLGTNYSVVEVTKSNYKKLEESKETIGSFVIAYNGKTTGKAYETEEKATKGLSSRISDFRFAEGYRLMGGTEQALAAYNTAAYEKAQKLNAAGIDYDSYYTAYMTLKQYSGDASEKREYAVSTIEALDLTKQQRLMLIYALGYSVKDGELWGLSSKAAKTNIARYIRSLKLSNEEKITLAKACGLTVKNGKIVTN